MQSNPRLTSLRKKANVECVEKLMKLLMIYYVNVVKWHSKNTRDAMIDLENVFTGFTGKRVHWFCRKLAFETKEKWYEHQPESV